jgi:hypothetical protein
MLFRRRVNCTICNLNCAIAHCLKHLKKLQIIITEYSSQVTEFYPLVRTYNTSKLLKIEALIMKHTFGT